MKNKIVIFLIIFSLLGSISLSFFSVKVCAVNLTGQITDMLEGGSDSAGLGTPASPQMIIIKIITAVLAVTGAIFLALIVYGGFVYVNSRGEEEQVKKAQKIVVAAIVGLAIILFSYSITLFVGGQRF